MTIAAAAGAALTACCANPIQPHPYLSLSAVGTGSQQHNARMQNWYLAAFGFAIVGLMIWLPGGILSIPERIRLKGTTR